MSQAVQRIVTPEAIGVKAIVRGWQFGEAIKRNPGWDQAAINQRLNDMATALLTRLP